MQVDSIEHPVVIADYVATRSRIHENARACAIDAVLGDLVIVRGALCTEGSAGHQVYPALYARGDGVSLDQIIVATSCDSVYAAPEYFVL